MSTSTVQQVHLGNLQDNAGARKLRRRLGRGIGSGRGKTAGRGHKGQKSRAGNHGLLGFEGGQAPMSRRYPKRGFNNPHSFVAEYQGVNVDRLMDFINAGRIDPTKTITMKTLRDCGCVRGRIVTGIKLLAGGSSKARIDRPLHIEVADASKLAVELVEKAGGTVTSLYYNRLGLRALLKPERFETIPKRASPPPKLMWKYPHHSTVLPRPA